MTALHSSASPSSPFIILARVSERRLAVASGIEIAATSSLTTSSRPESSCAGASSKWTSLVVPRRSESRPKVRWTAASPFHWMLYAEYLSTCSSINEPSRSCGISVILVGSLIPSSLVDCWYASRSPSQIPTPPDDLAYDAVPVSLRAVCDDAVVHLDQIEHRGLPVLLADYRDGMAFLAQLDSSLDLGSIRTV